MTREEAIKIINCYDIGFYDLSGEKIPADKLAGAFHMAIEALKAESVVSCKECKHNEGGTCGYSEFNIEVDDYCSFGERRTR